MRRFKKSLRPWTLPSLGRLRKLLLRLVNRIYKPESLSKLEHLPKDGLEMLFHFHFPRKRHNKNEQQVRLRAAHDSRPEKKKIMDLLSVMRARSIWLFDMNDLNPRGKNVENELFDWLKKSYSFSKSPSSLTDLDETKGLAFTGGTFRAKEKTFLQVELRVYSD